MNEMIRESQHSSQMQEGSVGNADQIFSYEYALIKVVPRVHLATFVNIGVILLCRNAGFLDAKVRIDDALLECLAPDLDRTMLRQFVDAYLMICRGGPEAGPVGVLPPSGRFHWLTAARSGVLQASIVHPGRCSQPEKTLEHLFAAYCSRP